MVTSVASNHPQCRLKIKLLRKIHDLHNAICFIFYYLLIMHPESLCPSLTNTVLINNEIN